MSEFEKQNAEVFAMVHDNPRRSGVLTDIGYIVPMKQAQSYAAYEAAQARNGRGIVSLILAAAGLLVTVTVTVLALA